MATVSLQDEHLVGSPTALGSSPNSAVCKLVTWGWALILSGLVPKIFISLSVKRRRHCLRYLLTDLLGVLKTPS